MAHLTLVEEKTRHMRELTVFFFPSQQTCWWQKASVHFVPCQTAENSQN